MLYSVKTTIENNVMGEWSEYFEQFPEEDPANRPPNDEQRMGPKSKYFPQWHESQITKEERAIVQALIEEEEAAELAFQNEIDNAPVIARESCPQCYSEGFEVKELNDKSLYCKCLDCGVSKIGSDLDLIKNELSESMWASPN